MHKTIENIIKKNLPETRYELGGYPEEGYYIEVSEDGEYIKSDEINTSLIADEVLKVVVEKIREYYEKFEDNDLNIFESTVLYQTREDVLQLLNNLK